MLLILTLILFFLLGVFFHYGRLSLQLFFYNTTTQMKLNPAPVLLRFSEILVFGLQNLLDGWLGKLWCLIFVCILGLLINAMFAYHLIIVRYLAPVLGIVLCVMIGKHVLQYNIKQKKAELLKSIENSDDPKYLYTFKTEHKPIRGIPIAQDDMFIAFLTLEGIMLFQKEDIDWTEYFVRLTSC